MTIDVTSVQEGDDIPPFEVTPDGESVRSYLSPTQPLPVFFADEGAAKALGLPGAIVPGPMKVGILYGAVDAWLGEAGYIRVIRAAHRKPDVQGHPVTVVGQVARVYEEEGAKRADLEMLILNRESQPSVRGFATVEFW